MPAEPGSPRGGDGDGVGRLDAVLFDMDGLLVETESTWYDAEQAVMARLGGRWSPEHQRALLGKELGFSARYMIDLAGVDLSPDVVVGWLRADMERRLRSAPVPEMPGARALLAALHRAGVPTALVSASPRVQVDAVLDSVGRELFATTVASDEVPRTKPHPDPYLRAAQQLGADPAYCVVLEDSPTGVAAGEAAGCAVVGVPGVVELAAAPGRLVVSSLLELGLADLVALVPVRRGSALAAIVAQSRRAD